MLRPSLLWRNEIRVLSYAGDASTAVPLSAEKTKRRSKENFRAPITKNLNAKLIAETSQLTDAAEG
jgi:hypothetical protein